MTSKLSLKTCIVALLASALVGCGVEDQDERIGAQEQAAGTSYLIAMSLNVRIPENSGERAWSVRLPYLRDMIRAYDGGRGPHLIGVQEFRRETFADLAAQLPGYWYFWVDRGDGERLAIFARNDRLTIESWDHRDVSNGARDGSCGWFDAEDSKNRPIQMVRVRDKQSGRRLAFYNTHYPSKNSCERHGMANIFADYIAQTKGSARVIVAGDLNDGVEPNGRLNGSFQRLLNRAGLSIAYARSHSLSSSSAFITGNKWDKDRRHGRMIDHILVSNPSAVVYSAVDRAMFTSSGRRVWCSYVSSSGYCGSYRANDLRLYSDHWAVYAYLQP